jgi:hypothetical protein
MNKQEYLDALHAARNKKYAWPQAPNHTGSLCIDLDGLQLYITPFAGGCASWVLWWHDEMLTHGFCETLALAKEEVLQYAEHYVRTVLYDSTPAMP